MKKSIFPQQGVLLFLFWLPSFFFELILRLIPSIIFTFHPVFFILLRSTLSLLFLIGWVVSITRCATMYPQQTLGGILLYFGVSILLAAFQYTGMAGQLLPVIGTTLAGMFSYTPLRGFTQWLTAYAIPYELYIIFGLTFLFVLSWVLGLAIRREYRE